MKAKTNVSEDGILMAALSEEDLKIMKPKNLEWRTLSCGTKIITKPDAQTQSR